MWLNRNIHLSKDRHGKTVNRNRSNPGTGIEEERYCHTKWNTCFLFCFYTADHYFLFKTNTHTNKSQLILKSGSFHTAFLHFTELQNHTGWKGLQKITWFNPSWERQIRFISFQFLFPTQKHSKFQTHVNLNSVVLRPCGLGHHTTVCF